MPNQTHHTLTAWFLSYSIQDRDIFTSVSHILSRGDFIVMISILFYQPAHFQYNEICSNYLDQNIICNVNRTYKHKRVNILVLRIHTLTTRNQMSPLQTLNLLLFWTRHQMGLMCSICSRDFFCIFVFFNFCISATFNVMISLQTKCLRAWQMEPLMRCGLSTSHLLNLIQRWVKLYFSNMITVFVLKFWQYLWLPDFDIFWNIFRILVINEIMSLPLFSGGGYYQGWESKAEVWTWNDCQRELHLPASNFKLPLYLSVCFICLFLGLIAWVVLLF